MLTDEKKKELIEKLGVSDEEFAELVKRKSEEKNVSPGGATLLLYYEAFNKPKGVDTTLENFSKPKEKMDDLFQDASDYLSQYAAVNQRTSLNGLKKLELEMKFSGTSRRSEAAAFAYTAGGMKPSQCPF